MSDIKKFELEIDRYLGEYYIIDEKIINEFSQVDCIFELKALINDICERCTGSRWKDNFDVDLWDMINGKKCLDYENDKITKDEILAISNLSERAGGWITWSDDKEETFITFDEWKK